MGNAIIDSSIYLQRIAPIMLEVFRDKRKLAFGMSHKIILR